MDLTQLDDQDAHASSIMFKILGPDGRELGPINADTLRQWVGERKIDPETLVRREGTAAWTPLRQLPELTGALPNPASAAATSPPPLPPAAVSRASLPSPSPAERPLSSDRPRLRQRTSGLAVATFVLSLLAFCTAGLSALAGVVLGFMALRQIKQSGGQLRGKGLAMTGQILSALSLLVLLVLAGFAWPEIAREHHKVGANQCMQHLTDVARGIRLNAEQHNGKFPAAADWCDSIVPQLGSEELLRCPRREEMRSGYAYNRNVAGRTTSSVPPDTVLLIESARGWNATASQEDPVAPSVHGGTQVVAFADGTVREVKVQELPSLRWEP